MDYSSNTDVNINIERDHEQSSYTLEEDIQIVADFSASLHDTLLRLDKRISVIDKEWSYAQSSYTSLNAEVNILEKSTTELEIEVASLNANYQSLYV